MLIRFIHSFIVLAVVFTLTADVTAQIPRQIAYQGILTRSDGTLLPDGNHTIAVSLYTTASGGSAIYTETQNVVVVKGLFNMMIGAVLPLPTSLGFEQAYFLGVAPDGASELVPRTALLPAPYAFNSAHAFRAEQALHANMSDSIALPYSGEGTNGSNPVFTVSNNGSSGSSIVGVGGGGSSIGSMTASALFGTGGAGYYGVTGFSDGGSDSYAGVLARGSGLTTGLRARSENGIGVEAISDGGIAGTFTVTGNGNFSSALRVSNLGMGEAITADALVSGGNVIRGSSLDTVGMSTGVLGESNSKTNGVGANGGASGIVGRIVRTSPGGYSAGVRGINNGTSGLGIGVVGFQNGSGWGVYGETPKGFGVYGLATDVTAPTTGVRGETLSPNGIGVDARYSGSGLGVALNVNNGTIKLSGTNKAAFIHTAATANKLSANGTDIDNVMCNGDPNCFVFVTQKLNPANITYNNSAIGVYYNTIRNKWEIFNESNAAIPDNAQFEVLVIKQ